jgi:meiotic recombination protein DMC1
MSNPIEKLEEYNISQKDIQKLKDIGINTIKELYMTNRKNLLNIKGFNENKIKKIFNEANKIEVYVLFEKGSTFMKARNNIIFKIPTSSNNLDEILGGGIESSSITEILGEVGTKKTDFVNILCASALKYNPKKKVMFIDFDKTFNLKKVIEYGNHLNININKKKEENILLINDIKDYEDFIKNLDKINQECHSEQISLIIIESIVSIFEEYFKDKTKEKINNSPINELEFKYDIESKLGNVLVKLKNISFLNNVAIVITRRIFSSAENKEDKNFDICSLMPNFEIMFGSQFQTRLKLKRIKNGKIKCFIMSSPMLPEKDCKFIINEKGILDC